MVRWHEAGKLRRKFFTGREAAEAHAISLRGSTLGADQQFLTLPQVDREKLVAGLCHMTFRVLSVNSDDA
jgi:hypothetical protein